MKKKFDDRRHFNEVDRRGSCECDNCCIIYLTIPQLFKSNIEIPLYSSFLLQLLPCLGTASTMMHYTGKSKPGCLENTTHTLTTVMLCTILWKKGPLLTGILLHFLVLMPNVKFHLANQIFYCSCYRGRKVIDGVNHSFEVGDHNFSKMSSIP